MVQGGGREGERGRRGEEGVGWVSLWVGHRGKIEETEN